MIRVLCLSYFVKEQFPGPHRCFFHMQHVFLRSAVGPGPGLHHQGRGASPSAGAQSHGHVRHLLRGRLLLSFRPLHPCRHVWPLPAQSPRAGCPTEGPGAAVGGHRGAQPGAAGQAQRD